MNTEDLENQIFDKFMGETCAFPISKPHGKEVEHWIKIHMKMYAKFNTFNDIIDNISQSDIKLKSDNIVSDYIETILSIPKFFISEIKEMENNERD